MTIKHHFHVCSSDKLIFSKEFADSDCCTSDWDDCEDWDCKESLDWLDFKSFLHFFSLFLAASAFLSCFARKFGSWNLKKINMKIQLPYNHCWDSPCNSLAILW